MDLGFLWYLLVAALLGGAYVVIAMILVPGLREERLKDRREVPAELFEWRVDAESEAGRAAQREGLQRETRLWRETGGITQRSRLLRQVRYRSAQTGDVVRVEADQRIRERDVLSSQG